MSIENIGPAIYHSISDAKVVFKGLFKIAGLLVENEDCSKELCDLGCDAVVVAAMNAHTNDADIAELGCSIFTNFTKNCNGRTRLGAIGACEAAVAALKLHGVENNIVAIYACTSVMCLSINKDDNLKIGECGGCEAVIAAIKAHPFIPFVVSAACRAIYELSKFYDCNRVKFGLRGCKSVCSALINHSSDIVVVEGAYLAITSLCLTHANAKRLGKLGCCDAVVTSMNANLSKADIVQLGCNTIVELVTNHRNNSTILKTAGACEAIVASITEHLESLKVVRSAIDAMSVLSFFDDACNAKFGICGGCKTLINAMWRHADDENTRAAGCRALVCFATINENKMILKNLSVFNLLHTLKTRHLSTDGNGLYDMIIMMLTN